MKDKRTPYFWKTFRSTKQAQGSLLMARTVVFEHRYSTFTICLKRQTVEYVSRSSRNPLLLPVSITLPQNRLTSPTDLPKNSKKEVRPYSFACLKSIERFKLYNLSFTKSRSRAYIDLIRTLLMFIYLCRCLSCYSCVRHTHLWKIEPVPWRGFVAIY